MSSLTLITGTIDEAEDPFRKLDLNELYYEKIYSDPLDDEESIVVREPVPIRMYNRDTFRIVQYLGSGKTLAAIQIMAEKILSASARLEANLGLVWHAQNESKPKEEWTASINTLEDFQQLAHCTALLDDIKGTVMRWNVKEADLISLVANAGRKVGLDLIMTAQREKMFPPEIRDMATEWIVPIIRVRDFRIPTPDKSGYPIELITLHFDGAKTFKYISNPLINLEPLFNAYSTLQKAITLKEGDASPRPNQPGFQLEVKALEFLRQKAPGMVWEHLNGKGVFDVESDTHLIDICDCEHGETLRTEHKTLRNHIRIANRQNKKPYLMFPYKDGFAFIKITNDLDMVVSNKRLHLDSHYKRIKPLDYVFG